ncbi:MAG: hypothetical protein JSW39_06565 [Desulfobacterales bacterium]|nr:MAG: hypothetical protein JSW39_06565 [Desulfobacterales bacterium]
MRRQLLLLAGIIMVMLVTSARMGWAAEYDFRRTKWGMPQEDVLAAEPMKPVAKNERMLTYQTKILEKNVDLFFLFVQDKLLGATYQLNEDYLRSSKYTQTFNTFKKALTKKYGPPAKEMTVWFNDLYRKKPAERGLALSLGHLEYYAVWETAATNIKCSLRGENYDILCKIEYSSKEYIPLLKEAEESEKVVIDPL